MAMTQALAAESARNNSARCGLYLIKGVGVYKFLNYINLNSFMILVAIVAVVAVIGLGYMVSLGDFAMWSAIVISVIAVAIGLFLWFILYNTNIQ